jgi:hypothetical protein
MVSVVRLGVPLRCKGHFVRCLTRLAAFVREQTPGELLHSVCM